MIIPVTQKLPFSWDDVTFGQGLKLIDSKDTADTIAVFTGLNPETLRHAQIKNLQAVLDRIKFLDITPMPVIMPKSINGFLLPKNLEFNTICRYEDCKLLVGKLLPKEEGAKLTSEQLAYYVEMVGIYTMPDYENAKPEDRKLFADQFYNSPCGEVMAIGNFTVMRYFELKIPGLKAFRKAATLMHRFRLGLKGYSARLGFSLRYFLWKKKPLTSGTKS